MYENRSMPHTNMMGVGA